MINKKVLSRKTSFMKELELSTPNLGNRPSLKHKRKSGVFEAPVKIYKEQGENNIILEDTNSSQLTGNNLETTPLRPPLKVTNGGSKPLAKKRVESILMQS